MDPEVRPLIASEVKAAADTLALAFETDPLYRYLLPDPRTRPKWLRWINRRALEEARRAGGAMTLGPELGSIGTFPPSRWPSSFLDGLASTPFPVPLPAWHFLRAGLHVQNRITQLHPREPHLYVYVLAIHPSQQGRGYGNALMRRACAIAERAGAPVHLETANPVNLPFYRRFGLEVVDELTSHGGPPLWTMTQRK